MPLYWDTINETEVATGDDGPCEYTDVERASVHGGWLVRSTLYRPTADGRAHDAISISICFVSDPTHEW